MGNEKKLWYMGEEKLVLTASSGNSFKGTHILKELGFNVPMKDGQLNMDKCLVGFSGYGMKFSKDHHVKDMSLKIVPSADSEIPGQLQIDVEANMNDDSDHYLDSAWVKLSFLIMADELADEETKVNLGAIRGFSLSYGKDDHHVSAYGVSMDSAFMHDNNGHSATGEVVAEKREVNEKVYNDLTTKHVYFVTNFSMSYNENEDHHVRETSVEVTYKESGENSQKEGTIYDTLILKDDSGNENNDGSCSWNTVDYSNFLTHFWNVNAQGINEYLVDKYEGDTTCHIQGIVKYNKKYVLSHNTNGNYGRFVIVNSDGYTDSFTFQTKDSGFEHPGGMQRLGSYLLVGLENGDHDKSHVRLYDLNKLTVNTTSGENNSCYEDFDIYRNPTDTKTSKGACSVGICKNTAKKMYIIAVYDPNKTATVDFYVKSYWDEKKNEELKLEKLKFDEYGSSEVSSKEYQNMALAYDEPSDTMYFLGFRRNNLNDFIDLYEVNFYVSEENEEKKTLLKIDKCIAKRHMHTEEGEYSGAVHFRWGAGLDIDKAGNVWFMATQRRSSGGRVDINHFCEPGAETK